MRTKINFIMIMFMIVLITGCASTLPPVQVLPPVPPAPSFNREALRYATDSLLERIPPRSTIAINLIDQTGEIADIVYPELERLITQKGYQTVQKSQVDRFVSSWGRTRSLEFDLEAALRMENTFKADYYLTAQIVKVGDRKQIRFALHHIERVTTVATGTEYI